MVNIDETFYQLLSSRKRKHLVRKTKIMLTEMNETLIGAAMLRE